MACSGHRFAPPLMPTVNVPTSGKRTRPHCVYRGLLRHRALKLLNNMVLTGGFKPGLPITNRDCAMATVSSPYLVMRE